MNNDIKLSENIGQWDGGEWHVTANVWRKPLEHNIFETFEIGIRCKATGTSFLLQSNKWNYQTVQEVANAIAHLIGMPEISGEHYTPEWCQEHFT